MPGNAIYLGDIFFQGGLITVVNGSDIVTSIANPDTDVPSSWTAFALAGDTISVGSTRHFIAEVISDTELRLSEPWSGESAEDVAYTGVNSPWHLADRMLGYKFSRFLQADIETCATAVAARDQAVTARGDALDARDLAQAWSSRPVGQDVTTTGTRSALHHATQAGTSASGAATSKTGADNSAIAAEASADRSEDWAERPVDTDVTTTGTRSALHHATKADLSRVAAEAAKDDAEAAQDIAVDSAADAEDAADAAAIDALATAADRVQTGLDVTATGLDRTATNSDRAQTGLDRTATTSAATAAAADRVQTGLDRTATAADALATAADRVQTGLDTTAAAASAAIAQEAATRLEYPDFGTVSEPATVFLDYGDLTS